MPARVHAIPRDGGRRFTFPLLIDTVVENLHARAAPAAVQQARAVFAARGLTEPSDIIPVAPNEPRTLWIPGVEDPYGNVSSPPPEMPTPLQLRIAVPPDANVVALRLQYDAGDDEQEPEEGHRDGIAALRVCLRIDEPIRYAFRDGALAVETDLLAATATGRIELESGQVGRLRGHTLYVSMTNASDEDFELLVTIMIER